MMVHLPESSFFLLSSNGFAICSRCLTDLEIGHYNLTKDFLPTWPSSFFRTRQDPRAVRCDRHRMLEMS